MYYYVEKADIPTAPIKGNIQSTSVTMLKYPYIFKKTKVVTCKMDHVKKCVSMDCKNEYFNK